MFLDETNSSEKILRWHDLIIFGSFSVALNHFASLRIIVLDNKSLILEQISDMNCLCNILSDRYFNPVFRKLFWFPRFVSLSWGAELALLRSQQVIFSRILSHSQWYITINFCARVANKSGYFQGNLSHLEGEKVQIVDQEAKNLSQLRKKLPQNKFEAFIWSNLIFSRPCSFRKMVPFFLLHHVLTVSFTGSCSSTK